MSRTIVSGPAGIFFQEIMGRGWVKGVQSEMDAWVVLGYQEAEITLSLSLWPSKYCLMCVWGHVEHEDLSFSSDIS